MPVGAKSGPNELIRRVRMVRGEFPFRLECRPAFDYARATHDITMTERGVRFDGPGISLDLASSVPLNSDGTGVFADFTLTEGKEITFVLRHVVAADGQGDAPGPEQAEATFRETVAYWRRGCRSVPTRVGGVRWSNGPALTLKLLSFEPTGAIVASPTCSLPESIGGPRNWDYRYTWIRDAAFTLYSLECIGFTEETDRFRDWLKDRWNRATAEEQDRCSRSTGSTAVRTSPRRRSTTWRAIEVLAQSVSATVLTNSCNLISTAN